MRMWRTSLLAALICAGALPAPQAQAQTAGLRAFASDQELATFLKRRARQHPAPMPADLPPPAPTMVMAPSSAPGAANEAVVVTGTRAASPSITNTQEADVDEGGIVKVHGNHLVVLRRGRLFTVRIGDGAMRAVDHVDAFPPGTNGDAWYDEMLVSGDRVIVVGYSYERGGTEINRFRIDAAGRLRYEDSHHLRSNDYYSSSNYASRLIGSQLIFYTPLDLDPYAPILAQLPALRRWTGKDLDRYAGLGKDGFQRITPATRVYVPEPIRRDPDADISTLHTVTVCDLAAPRLSCRATAVLGSDSSNFYVSGNAVYVWIGEALPGGKGHDRAMLYRMPLDGSRPGALQAWGGPVDQFSFREDRAARALDVVVRAESRGDWMWRPEVSSGDAALLRLPLSAFGNGAYLAPGRAYRPLPLGKQPDWSFHNRFMGRHLVYSAGRFAGEQNEAAVFVVPLDGGLIGRIRAPHGVDRIDIIGDDAVVIGNDAKDRLGFSAIELAGGPPRLGDTSFLPAAREGERRSQAFFYRPDPNSRDGSSGTLGLPVTRDLGKSAAARFLGSGSAVAFLRRDARRLAPAGELAAHAETARDDDCKASCVDWYGNARPIFLGDRVFALMGYELVEGKLSNGRIREYARLDFAPTAASRK